MNRTRHWLLIISMLLITLSACFALSLSVSYADTTSYSAKVTATTLNVRSGPSTDYAIVGKLSYNQKIAIYSSVTKDGQKWYKISYNSKTAYVYSSYIKFLSKTIIYSPTRTGKFIKDTNIRKGPSTSYAILGTLSAGAPRNIYASILNYVPEINEEWYRISFNGEPAYVIAHNVLMTTTVLSYDPPKIGLSTKDTYYRSSPYESASVVGPLEKNSLVKATALVTTNVESAMNKWYKTTYNCATAYVYIGDVRIVSTDDATAFEEYLTVQGFPESYKKILRTLHTEKPNWIFRAQKTGLDWDDVLAKEKQIGTSLLAASQPEAWKSFDEGAYDFTKGNYKVFDGSWNAADYKVVAYYLDPRNFLNETSIYQFMDHKFDAASQNTSMIRAIAAGSFMDTDAYATMIYNSGKASAVNPNVITSIIRQEQGNDGTSGSISGTYPGYVDYYNYFNVGSWTTSSMSAVERGLWWAKGEGIGATTYGRPWNTRTKSITGGALYYKANYIDEYQNTFYLKKFNVLNGLDNVATHQYMTHILAADREGASMSQAYAAYPDNASIFSIPVYSNMPTSPVSKPGTTGNNDNVLNSLRVVRADTEFQYPLTRSNGGSGFTRYTTDYTVNVPSSVTKIIVNGVAHNNVSYVSAKSSYISLGAIDSSLPDGYQNIGKTTLTTLILWDSIYIREGAGITFDKIGSYLKGTKVTVTGSANDPAGVMWYKVTYDGKVGYISSEGTNKITNTTYYSDWMTGTTKVDLNVRKSPSSTSTALGELPTGTKTIIYGYVINPDLSKWYMTSYKGATVTGGDVITLQTGTNVIKLVVKSTSGRSRTYTITVNRI